MSKIRVPRDWDQLTVRQVTTRHFSGPSPTCEERNMATHDEWGLLKTTAITWKGWNAKAHKVPPSAYWGNEQIEVRRGDVIVTKAGPRHRVGVVAYVTDTPAHLMVSGKMVGLTPDEGLVLPQVLAGALSMRSSQKYLDERTTGMAESQVNFTNDVLLATPIAVPPMREQQRIAEILGSLDEAIRSTERLIAKLEQVKLGLLHDLLTRGMDELSRMRDPSRDSAQFHVTVLGILPSAWEVTTLKEISLKITDGTHQSVTTVEHESDTVPFLYVSCIGDNEIRWSRAGRISTDCYSRISQGRVPVAGMVLYTAVGSYGNAAVVKKACKFAFQRHIACIYPDASKIVPAFIALWLNGRFAKDFSDRIAIGNAQKTVTLGALAEFPVPVPPKGEQVRLLRTVEQLDVLRSAEMSNLAKLWALKRGLTDDLLTGRVRVGALA